MNFAQIKNETKQAIQGNKLMILLSLLVIGMLTSLVTFTVIGALLGFVLAAGSFLLIKTLFKEHKFDFALIFDYFKDLNHALKIIGVGLMVMILIWVGLILLIIPGIIFMYQYSQAIYIMAENKDIDVFEALRRSKEMMKGYKFDFFLFQLSFILHYLLIIITFGIYAFWFLPYYQSALINYYLHLSKQNGQEVMA